MSRADLGTTTFAGVCGYALPDIEDNDGGYFEDQERNQDGDHTFNPGQL
jgi:hypothetical protein